MWGVHLCKLHWTLVTLIGRNQGRANFEALYLVKEQSKAICYY